MRNKKELQKLKTEKFNLEQNIQSNELIIISLKEQLEAINLKIASFGKGGKIVGKCFKLKFKDKDEYYSVLSCNDGMLFSTKCIICPKNNLDMQFLTDFRVGSHYAFKNFIKKNEITKKEFSNFFYSFLKKFKNSFI